jgi:hypothetical protein
MQPTENGNHKKALFILDGTHFKQFKNQAAHTIA